MYASYESSTAAHVSSSARAGAAQISSSAYVFGGSVYTCI